VDPPDLGSGDTRSVTEVLYHFNGPLAQCPEHAASIRKVPGETPGGATTFKYQRGIIVVRLPVKENGDRANRSAGATLWMRSG